MILRHKDWTTTLITMAMMLLLATGVWAEQAKKPPEEPYIPDIGTFMKIGGSSSPGYSRCTGEFYFTSLMSGANQLYRITEKGWPYQLTLFDDGIDGYSLSHAGDYAGIRASVGGSEQSQLYLMNAITGRIEKLTDNPEVQHGTPLWKKDGSGFYFRSNEENLKDFKIYFYNLAERSYSIVFDMEGANYLADLSHDERYLIVFHLVSNVNDDLYMIDLQSGEYELLTPHKGEVFYDYPTIMPDNKTLYLTCNDNKLGIFKRARLDVATKKIEYLDPESNWTIEGLNFSHDRRYMIWRINEDGYSMVHLWDMIRNKPIPGPPVRGYVGSAIVLDDGRALFSFSSPSRAPDVWIWDWQTPELKKLTHAKYAGINPDIFVEPTLVKYKSFDGLEIPAFLYLPPNYNGEPIPFILHIHGGPEGQFRPYFQRNFQYLVLHGYGVLAPNVRGSSGYGKEYMNLDNYRNRLQSIKDIKAGVDYLIKNDYTRKGMIGIKGASYGGYAVLAAITEYPDLFSAGVDEVGIANFVTFLENTKDYRRHLREAEYGPLTDREFLESVSPIHKAKSIKTPLLVIHGENDPRVPVGEARQIIKAIQDNGGVVDSLIFPDEGHGVAKRENNLKVYRRMMEFFHTHLQNN
ncbi:MAG: S9 family peptidase [Candidatus Zixiibacteriota bacterium]|nr:MAG: S9 family peptidase [candidate division Zixibacteria bacterium]